MMLTPCCPSAGPTGGAGVAFPAGSCNLTTATTFFMRPPERLLDLLHLGEIQLHGRLPAEDRHQDPDLLLLREDLVHDPGEVHEGPRVDAHRRPLLVGDPELRRLVPELAQDRLHLRSWRGSGLPPDPTKPVTPGVLRTTYQESSSMIISTSTYPGNTFFLAIRRFPSLISISSSVGTRMRKIFPCIPMDATRRSRFVRTLFSYPE